MPIFKVWNCSRSQKKLVKVEDDGSILENLIKKASEKLSVRGVEIVLESDGTTIDESDVLKELGDQVLILLGSEEKWTPSFWIPPIINNPTTSSNMSGSTITILNSEQSFFDDINLSNVPMIPTVATEFTWVDFKIPWDKLPNGIIAACENGDRNYQNVSFVVHHVVNSMREIKTSIPCKAFKYVARKMVEKYPAMFKDIDDDNVVLGDGCHTIYSKLAERNSYLNRPHKMKSSDQRHNEISQAKKVKKAQVGCSNWEPSEESFADTEYLKQRKFLNDLNKIPTLAEIYDKFPNLLSKNGIYDHFEKLTLCKIDVVRENIISKFDRIICFAAEKKFLIPKEVENIINIINIFAAYFKEDAQEIIIKTQNPEVSLNFIFDPNDIMISSPRVIYADGSPIFYVAMEQKCIAEFDNSLDGVLAMFAIYFNFNLEYPKSVSCCLEMIQRYFFKIHPDSGSKSKKISVSKKKVLNLITKLSKVKV